MKKQSVGSWATSLQTKRRPVVAELGEVAESVRHVEQFSKLHIILAEGTDVSELSVAVAEFFRLLLQETPKEKWESCYRKYMLIPLVRRKLVARAFLEGESCTVWPEWIITLMVTGTLASQQAEDEEPSRDETEQEKEAEKEVGKEKERQPMPRRKPPKNADPDMYQLGLLSFTSLFFHSFVNHHPTMFSMLLATTRSKLAGIPGIGWTPFTVAIARAVLSSLVNKIDKTAANTLKKDTTVQAWDNLWALTGFIEDFIFYHPSELTIYGLDGHIHADQQATSMGFHLNDRGCSDLELITLTVHMLRDSLDVNNLIAIFNPDKERAQQERKLMDQAKAELLVFEQLQLWGDALARAPSEGSFFISETHTDSPASASPGKRKKHPRQEFQDVVSDLFELVSKRNGHSHTPKKLLQLSLSTARHHVIRLHIKIMAESLPPATRSQPKTFATLPVELVNRQVEAGLYVMKRMVHYLGRVVEPYHAVFREIDKATMREMQKDLTGDGMTDHADVVVMLQVITRSLSDRTVRFVRRIQGLLNPISDFLLSAELTRKAVMTEALSVQKDVQNLYAVAKKAEDEARAVWSRLLYTHVNGRGNEKRKDKLLGGAQRSFMMYETAYESYTTSAARAHTEVLPKLLTKLQDLELRRLALLKHQMEGYLAAVRAFEKPHSAVDDLEVMTADLDVDRSVEKWVLQQLVPTPQTEEERAAEALEKLVQEEIAMKKKAREERELLADTPKLKEKLLLLYGGLRLADNTLPPMPNAWETEAEEEFATKLLKVFLWEREKDPETTVKNAKLRIHDWERDTEVVPDDAPPPPPEEDAPMLSDAEEEPQQPPAVSDDDSEDMPPPEEEPIDDVPDKDTEEDMPPPSDSPVQEQAPTTEDKDKELEMDALLEAYGASRTRAGADVGIPEEVEVEGVEGGDGAPLPEDEPPPPPPDAGTAIAAVARFEMDLDLAQNIVNAANRAGAGHTTELLEYKTTLRTNPKPLRPLPCLSFDFTSAAWADCISASSLSDPVSDTSGMDSSMSLQSPEKTLSVSTTLEDDDDTGGVRFALESPTPSGKPKISLRAKLRKLTAYGTQLGLGKSSRSPKKTLVDATRASATNSDSGKEPGSVSASHTQRSTRPSHSMSRLDSLSRSDDEES